jgi:hypothetical protein
MGRCVERRVYGVHDRRRRSRGGRRKDDLGYPSGEQACPACLNGVATLVAAPDGDLSTLTYRCTACDHQFAEPA